MWHGVSPYFEFRGGSCGEYPLLFAFGRAVLFLLLNITPYTLLPRTIRCKQEATDVTLFQRRTYDVP